MLSLEMMDRLKIDFDKWGKWKISELVLEGAKKADGKCVTVFMNVTSDKKREVCFMGAAALGAVGVSFWELYEISQNLGRIELSEIIEGATGKRLFDKEVMGHDNLFDYIAKLNDYTELDFEGGASTLKEIGE